MEWKLEYVDAMGYSVWHAKYIAEFVIWRTKCRNKNGHWVYFYGLRPDCIRYTKRYVMKAIRHYIWVREMVGC